MATIESQDLTLGKLFNDFYIVPSYQREYVWEEKQVSEFFQDIYDEFSASDSSSSSEYFIGSIIVCMRLDGLYEVIDGQQRMTTAYLVLCAVRDYLEKLKPGESIELLKSQIASTDIDNEGNNIFRYRITLQYRDSCGVLEKIAQQDKLNSQIPETRSSQNIINAYELIISLLERQFSENDASLQTVKKFYAYFNKNVKLVRVKTASVADALRVFATINNRGLSLNPIDLVKNLMFMKADKKEYDHIAKQWKKIIDTLFIAKEDPMRFIRYFILSRYEVDTLRREEIFRWFLNEKNRKLYENQPTAFVDSMLDAAKAYVNFTEGKDVQGKNNRYLENIQHLSSAARMPLMLLLAGQNLSTDCFNELCRQVENLFFAYLITREPTSNFERRFAQWCSQINKVTDKEKLDKFIIEQIQPAKQKVAEHFELAFSGLKEKSVPKTQMRYILAKLVQYVDESAYNTEIELKSYINKTVEIEHILPQTPELEIKLSFDKPEEIEKYIARLGNLTLLEKSINASVGNKPFKDKKEAYPTSKFLLSRAIAKKVTVGVDTAIDRALQDIEPFEQWTSQSIEKRQEMLTQLAKKVWDMPK
ncbi:DUF262 domain-containing protein [[Phormidium ambiguum] IAM M-71]|nr:DUF262 domain-containing protein [Phormidium ambiguum]